MRIFISNTVPFTSPNNPLKCCAQHARFSKLLLIYFRSLHVWVSIFPLTVLLVHFWEKRVLILQQGKVQVLSMDRTHHLYAVRIITLKATSYG